MILKTKTELKDRHDNNLGLCFLLIDWSSFGEGERDSLEIGHSRSIGWMNFGRKWTRGLGGCLKIGQFSWTLYVYYPLKLVTIPHISKKSCHCYYCCCTWNTATGIKCCLFHSYRTYHQKNVKIWTHLVGVSLFKKIGWCTMTEQSNYVL